MGNEVSFKLGTEFDQIEIRYRLKGNKAEKQIYNDKNSLNVLIEKNSLPNTDRVISVTDQTVLVFD